MLNELLARQALADYDYLVLADDDVVFPRHFLDPFIALQAELGFALAQPARTPNSFIDYPIVERQRGAVARQTLFVEIGPVVRIHRSLFDVLLPFDQVSPMGWGYENVWSYQLAQRALKMGIIDAVPVDHSLRPPVHHYNWDEANNGRTVYLEQREHLPYGQCFRVIDVVPLKAGH